MTAAAPRSAIDVGEIAGMLAARCLELCRELLPAGVVDGAEYRVGSVAGEPGRSMAVHLRGGKAGVWSDFSTGETGDALDLVAAVLFAGRKGEAVGWARSWLGLDGRDPDRLRQSRRAVDQAKAAEDKAADDALRRRNQAFRIWLDSGPIAGTVADRYLCGRGIDLSELGRAPRALRFHRALWNGESGRRWPALTAAIADASGRFVAVHRTWLCEGYVDGRAAARKAPLADAKMTLGRYAGGCIRVWRGASGKSLKEAPEGDEAVLTEGIEDALSVALALPDKRVLACVSVGNMGRLELPPAIGVVTICADNDPPDSRAADALRRAIDRFLGEGRRVRLVRPPPGCKDLNELLTRPRTPGREA